MLHGNYTLHTETGQTLCELFYQNGDYDGEQRYYYQDGKLLLKKNYKDAGLNGKFEKHHPNGQIRVKGQYLSGTRDGDFFEYYENGQLKSEVSFRDGVHTESKNSFYKNGRKKLVSMTKEGKFEGMVSLYHANGRLFVKAQFVNGRRNGRFSFKDEKGKSLAIFEYAMGDLKGKKVSAENFEDPLEQVQGNMYWEYYPEPEPKIEPEAIFIVKSDLQIFKWTEAQAKQAYVLNQKTAKALKKVKQPLHFTATLSSQGQLSRIRFANPLPVKSQAMLENWLQSVPWQAGTLNGKAMEIEISGCVQPVDE